MLKRRAKIQKYISALKNKQIKKQHLKNHNILKHKIQDQGASNHQDQQQPKDILLHVEDDAMGEHHNVVKEMDIPEPRETACWADNDDDDERVVVGEANRFRKLGGIVGEVDLEQYERKVGKFYQSRQKQVNWAQEADLIMEKDVNDYLNEEMYYSDKKPAKQIVKFHSKTTQKHESIVSGLTWHKHVLFTCGLDHKIKVHHFDPEQANPELKLTQEKDIFVKDLPLSSCELFRDPTKSPYLVAGSLRKNLIKVDTEKWVPEFITSTFLKDMKTYENLRVGADTGYMAVYSAHRVAFLDKNFVFGGSLLANQKIQDLCFAGNWGVYGVTNEAFYEWDVRKMEIVRMQKKYLGYTSITSTPTTIPIGSKLGTVYFYKKSCPSLSTESPPQNTNLLTHITSLSTNPTGSLCLSLSKWKSNAVRVVDAVTGKSIGDWPTTKTKTGIPICGGFGGDDCFGVGNADGVVNVYRVEMEA